MSFNLNKQYLQNLYTGFASIYNLKIIFPVITAKTAEQAFDRLLGDTMRIILKKVAFIDALIISTAESAPQIDHLITWNAKHFLNKTKLIIQTPEEYLMDGGEPI